MHIRDILSKSYFHIVFAQHRYFRSLSINREIDELNHYLKVKIAG